MNKYRKLFSQKNKKKKTIRKTLKRNATSKNKYKKLKRRYQIGCSQTNNMKGGGIQLTQAFSDAMNGLTSFVAGSGAAIAGTPHADSVPTFNTPSFV